MKQSLMVFLLISAFFTDRRAAAEQGPANDRDAVRRALAWLVRTIESKAWDVDAQSLAAGGGRRDMATLAAAWLMEANLDFAEFDQKTRARLRDRADLLAARKTELSEYKKHNSYIQGFAALYAYERSLRESKPHPALDSIARGFLGHQNAEGGWWNYGLDYGRNHYVNTMIAPTNLALLALGAAGREKTSVAHEIDYKLAVEEGLQVLHDAQGSQGGMPYGGQRYRRHAEAGRTASMLLALSALQRTDSELFRRAAVYVWRNLESIPYGHGSAPMHVALGGLACSMLSDEAWHKYQQTVLKKIRQAQGRDGSFDKTAVYPSTDTLFIFEEPFVTAYLTALYSLGLCADRTAVAQKLRLQSPFHAPAEHVREPEKLPAPAWEFRASEIAKVEADAQIAAVLHKNGAVTCIDVPSGRQISKISPLAGDEVRAVKLCDDKVLVLSAATPKKGASSSGVNQLFCYDPKKDKRQWQTPIQGAIQGFWPAGAVVAILTEDSRMVVIDAATGRISNIFSVLEDRLKFIAQPLSTGGYYPFASEDRLVVYDGAGKIIWKDRSPVERGLYPPHLPSVLVASTDRLYVGGVDGQLECRDLATGEVVWQAALKQGSSIRRICVTGMKPERILAVDEDGLVHGIENGKVVYRVDAGCGREQIHANDGNTVPPLVCRQTAAGVLLLPPGGDYLTYVAADGGERKDWELSEDEAWLAAGRYLFTWSDDYLRAYVLR